LTEQGERSALALSRVARCLEKLGRHEEARAVWKKLAAAYADERDLSHRPYGIVAAIAAGDTSGLADQIATGRWELAADQAEYFLAELDAIQRSEPYRDRFRFARAIEEAFRPAGLAREGELHPYSLGDYRLYYRAVGPEQVDGLAVDTGWVEGALRPQAERDLGLTEEARREVLVYGGAIALVLLVLSAGIALLLREVGRETRTNRPRADFVSGVSHELKTPITLIRLYGDTLLERPGLGPSERSDFYRIIVRESERLTRLVNQVLTFSRVERGAERYNMEIGDLAPPILRLMDDYSEYIERTGFTLRCELDGSTSPVRFDATAVLQAVANLLDNAVKYSGESRGITARLSSQGGTVVFEVEDRGCGIPEAERQKIFDRFYRVANGSGKGGYGLGLFLVRHIMQAHGGRVEVESEPGRGSTFRLVFPGGDTFGGAGMSEARILVIEDEPDLLRGLELNLKAEGYAVLSASRGDAGLEKALRERPDLVLLDIMLAGDERAGRLPRAARAGIRRAHYHAYGGRRGSGPRGGTGDRRRRLRHQTLRHPGTDGADSCPAAKAWRGNEWQRHASIR
jgi:signal transduction histidine kinase